MSEQDRIHEASPIRLLQAKEDGMAARSAELSRSLVFCLLMSAVFFFSGVFLDLFARQLVVSLSEIKLTWSPKNWSTLAQNATTVPNTLLPLIVFLSSFVIIATLIWHLQSPLSPKIQKALPDFSRVSPVRFWQQILSLGHWIKIVILVLGFALTTFIALSYAWSQSSSIASLAGLDLDSGLKSATSFLKNSMIAAGLIMLLLGIADYVRERIQLALKLRMTDQERREEARNTEMNPEVRRRLLG